MPTYQYKCELSAKIIERHTSIKNHSNKIMCNCGAIANQVILRAPTITIPQHMRYDFNGYESPIDGRVIRNMKERSDDLARSGCIEYDPGMVQDADRRVIEADIALDKMVEETVERELETMPLAKKELLSKELESGNKVEFTRGSI